MFKNNILRNLYKNDSNYKIFLFFYHLAFSFLAYQLRINRGVSDSHFYWAKNININNNSWFDFADYGANFVLFLNYPLIKLGIPFLGGFLIYGIIGYLGILKWIEFSKKVVGKIYFKGYNVLPILFFLPNLHYWTATLGKEPLVFFAIASIFNYLADFKANLVSTIIAFTILLLIRPHVAILLLISIVSVVLFQKKYSLKNRLIFLFSSLTITSILLYMVLQLALIHNWNWSRVVYSNNYSILSFSNSKAYVPMLDYSIWYKLFSFNFRPLFYDSQTIWSLFASIENVIILSFYLLFFILLIVRYKKNIFPEWMKIVLLFTLLSCLIYVQRYANLGIFMRTKIMFQPFMLIAIISFIQHYLNGKSKKDNE
jgi:hypothetical protein